jgi:NADH dehydrogenase FAD-containing subunit
MSPAAGSAPESLPTVVIGAGYAGLTVAQEVDRRSRGRVPLVLIDHSPVHELRSELYEIGRLAASGDLTDRWVVPFSRALDRTSVTFHQGTVQSIDLSARAVTLDSGEVRYRSLAICLGNVAAYYGVPGAAEYTHQVYRLSGAKALAARLREIETASAHLSGERRPRIVVVGGGSTGVELAAEIATTDWGRITGVAARPPDVFLLTGSLPFLAGFPAGVVQRARTVLVRSGVGIVHGLNVTRVERDRLTTEDGSVFAFDAAVWCAGLEAPPLVRQLPLAHGRAGRIAVDATLEVPEHPGVFAVGDVAEVKEPTTHAPIPSTAQAALAEARVAARNLVARWKGSPLVPFEFHERGVVVALGLGQAAGAVRKVPVWGSPAALLKQVVQRDYAHAVEHGDAPSLI